MHDSLHGIAYLDLLKLTPVQQESIIRQLDAEEADQPGRSKRRSPRLSYPFRDGTLMTVLERGHGQPTYRVVMRNISDHGAGVLHCGFLHRMTPVRLTLVTEDNETLQVRGTVQRCGFVKGKVHDVGIAFDQPIAARSLLAMEAEEEMGVGAPASRVLLAEDAPLQRRLTSYFLQKLGVEPHVVGSGREALTLSTKQPFDMLMLGLDLPDIPGDRLAARMRKNGLTVPIIALSVDEDESCVAEAIQAGCDAFLAKPITRTKLADVMERWLGDPDDEPGKEPRVKPLYSELWDDPYAHAMVREFLEWLRDETAEVRRVHASRPGEAAARVRAMCGEMRLTCASMGYPRIAQAAQELAQCVEDDGRPEAYRPSLTHLCELCDRACGVLPPQPETPG